MSDDNTCESCEYFESYYFDEYDSEAYCTKNDNDDTHGGKLSLFEPVDCEDFKYARRFKRRFGYDISDNFVDKKDEYTFDNSSDEFMDSIVDTLNKQDEIIQNLKHDLRTMRKKKEYAETQKNKYFDTIVDLRKKLEGDKKDFFEFESTVSFDDSTADELHIRDKHTKVHLVDGNQLHILVFTPDCAEPFEFCYYVHGKNLIDKKVLRPQKQMWDLLSRRVY